ncbi:MAG: protein-disulfide reductase DsbD domain-containing protein [Terriglobales bacterium]
MIKYIVSVLLLAAAAFAQSRAPKVTALPIAKVTVPQGGKANVEMSFRVAPGFHINSNKPTSDLYIPTAVRLDVPTDISVGKMEYPEGELVSFPFDPDTKLSVYTGDIAVKGLVMTAKSTPRGTYRVHGNLRYQACDNRACYPPVNLPVAFDVTVSSAPASHRGRRNPAQSPHIHN